MVNKFTGMYWTDIEQKKKTESLIDPALICINVTIESRLSTYCSPALFIHALSSNVPTI